jgi:hypothetical protein
MLFSQRVGKTPAQKTIQHEAMDEELRNSLWSALALIYWESYRAPGSSYHQRNDYVRSSNMGSLIVPLWISYFKKPIDTMDEYWPECLSRLRGHFFKLPWHGVFDFVEFVAQYGTEDQRSAFTAMCNSFLERENSAYRFLNGSITEIVSESEIDEVETAIARSSPYSGVKVHLETAVSLMSNRINPDFRNSIKESISAVESLAKKISGDQSSTLEAILKELEKSHALHPALKNAFSSLYGYTSDSQGIRHALMDNSSLTKADARFMLISCSAFVNYAIEALAKK